MGVFKAFSAAAKGAMEDQWLEAFTCDALDTDTLVLRGHRMQSERSANEGNENVISAGSVILVPDGACAVITEMGKVIALYDAPGEHRFTGEKARGVFGGAGVSGLLRDVGERFTYGGDVPIVQRVYFVNTKEILGNPFSFGGIPVRLFDANTKLDMDASVSAEGTYSYRIVDPLLFYKNVSGNVSGTYTRTELHAQMLSELASAFAPALAEVCRSGVRPYALSEHIEQIDDAVQRVCSERWKTLRGIEMTSVSIGALTVAQQDMAVVQQTQHAKALTDPALAAATLTAAQADAMKLAAGNTAGSMLGAALLANAANPALWCCVCGQWNRAGFCENCGKPRSRPQSNARD
ncbi:MAG: SPFH domain-containing protein [Clostridia bacterium]|nr:SPFH domain-containing protein [Clostridia bacterium]